MIRVLLFVVSAIGLFCPLVFGRILQVPVQLPSIQSAINSSVNGDTILVSTGVYLENLSFRGKRITVASGFLLDPNPTIIQQTIIDGGTPVNSDSGSVVRFMSREDSLSVLCGFTLRNGIGTLVPGSFAGGGIIVTNSSAPTICYNIIRGNSAIIGGGIAVRNSLPTIRNNAIVNNTARDGGGIWMENSSCVIDHNVIHTNRADALGGAVCIKSSFAILSNCSFSSNLSPICGGISCVSGGWNINNCNFFQNQVANLQGCGGPGLGENFVSKNYNLDSADTYMNIVKDPGFANAVALDFRLTCGSRLIDAGSVVPTNYPTGGSRSDIGMFEYDYRVGDLNNDKKVNIADATALVNIIFLASPTNCPVYADDCDCNRRINVTDIVALINYWSGFGELPGCLFIPR